MNSSFSLQRVGLLIKRYFAEGQNRKIQFVMLGTLILIFGSLFFHFYIGFKQILYMYAIILPINQFGFFYVGETDTINYLLIPTSNAEKIVAAFVLNTVYLFVAIVITYCFVNLVSTPLSNIIQGTSNPICLDFLTRKGMLIYQYTINNNLRMNIWNIMGEITIIQALAVLTQFGFKQKSFWKHALLLLVFLIPALISMPFIINNLITKFNSFFSSLGSLNFHISPFQINDNFQFTTLFLYFLIAAFIWRVNYLSLSKKQI